MIEDLSQLRAFVEVCTCGSMTAAAESLGITQSAVSQKIQQLESSLGAELLDRSERPLRPTAAGTVLQHRAAALLSEASVLPSVIREASRLRSHELRIGIVDSFASTVGPALIRAVLPDVTRLSFRSGLANDQAEGLLTRKLDMIITSDPMDDIDGLVREHILTEPFVLLLPKAGFAYTASPDLKALAAQHSFIRFSARSMTGAQIERHLRRLNIRAPVMLEVDSTDALFALVAEGLGWGIATPLCVLQAGAHVGRMRVLPFPAPGFVRQLHLLWRADELGTLPLQIAQTARDIFERERVPELIKIAPWLRGQFAIGSR